MSDSTYLITGASRGIGKGLLATLILRDNTTVIAAVRNTATAQPLYSLPVGPGSKLIIVKIDSAIESYAAAAAEELKTKHAITKVDYLISNAGICAVKATVLETSAEQVRQHFEINTIAPMVLLQAFMPLLSASASPKFLVISSVAGSTASIAKYGAPFLAYGMSKSAVNHMVMAVAAENPAIVCMAVHPGFVKSDMGNWCAGQMGMEADITVEECVEKLVRLFDGASKEKTGGYVGLEGETIPW